MTYLGSVCGGSTVDCSLLSFSILFACGDSIRFLIQYIIRSIPAKSSSSTSTSSAQARQTQNQTQSPAYKSPKQHAQPTPQVLLPSFFMKILIACLLFCISAFQLIYYLLSNSSSIGTASIEPITLLSSNVLFASTCILALLQDRTLFKRTSTWTKASICVNLLTNMLAALISERNTTTIIPTQDTVYFYVFFGYLICAFIQIGIQLKYSSDIQKPSMTLDELERQCDNSIMQANQNTNSNHNNHSNSNANASSSSKNSKYNENSDNKSTSISQSLIPKKSLNEPQEQKQNSQIEPNNQSDHSPLQSYVPPSPVVTKSAEPSQLARNQLTNDQIEGSSELQSNKQQQSTNRIENIRIEKFFETIKYQKKTIVYEIKCTYRGKMNSVKRSFREFGSLNSSLRNKYKNIVRLPPFPQKKEQNSILTFADLEDRKKQLCTYLQALSVICESEDIAEFLTSMDARSSQQKYTNHNNNATSSELDNNSGTSDNTLYLSAAATTGQLPAGRNSMNSAGFVPETIWEVDEDLSLSSSSNFEKNANN